MGEIAGVVDDWVARCQLVFEPSSGLASAIPGFVARAAQTQLTLAIALAIRKQTTLVAEAGTGTGKTYAYLIPCLLSGKKALISTATKTLQDQLFQKDLPTLVRALGLSVRIQNLKGRSNYLCRYRIELHANEHAFNTPQCASDVALIREKLPRLTHGERVELPEIAEDAAVWPYVTSTTDNCLGTDCQDYQDCFLVKARRRAMKADVVVINHHLFFADSRLQDDGCGELLPGVEAVVFDEAHALSEIAIHFHGEHVGTRQLRELMDDLLREWPVLDLANQPLKSLSVMLDQLIDQLVMAYPGRDDRLHWSDAIRHKPFMNVWERLLALLDEWLDSLNAIGIDSHAALLRCKMRLESLHQMIMAYPVLNRDRIQWIERFKHSLVFHITPVDVSTAFCALLAQKPRAYVFASATLTMAGSFDCFTQPLGLSQAETLCLPSPFDFKQQALLYLPRGMPDPANSGYYEQLLARALSLINAFGGRCFFLFTSHRALKQVAELLGPSFPYPLLVQGDEAKPILLARFRELGNAVLLGTATFWEGVDVKGEALSCVIIDKLPFASPSDPVIRGRMAHFAARGLSGFHALSLPKAVLALKQGIGRLIRDATDRGVVMIADPRLTGRTYGRFIFESLPPMRKTRDEAVVLTFINQLRCAS